MYEATEDKGRHQKASVSNQKRASANAISIQRTSNGSAEQKRRLECPLCPKDHHLAYCEEYEKRTPEQRGELVRKRHLCFNCLRPGHRTSGCRSKYSCNEECDRRHHSSLHASMTRRETKEKTNHDTVVSAANQSNATSCAVGTKGGVFLNVVPVRVIASNGKAVNTYTLLDSGSTAHLCDRRLLQALGVEGKPTNVALSTVTCDLQKHNSVSADLMISTLEGEESIP